MRILLRAKVLAFDGDKVDGIELDGEAMLVKDDYELPPPADPLVVGSTIYILGEVIEPPKHIPKLVRQ